jgi:hypothetical protein
VPVAVTAPPDPEVVPADVAEDDDDDARPPAPAEVALGCWGVPESLELQPTITSQFKPMIVATEVIARTIVPPLRITWRAWRRDDCTGSADLLPASVRPKRHRSRNQQGRRTNSVRS